ncbi:hypothetical protein FRC17_009026 [Serendipita sp. 399]|nr:hypothetical protein FRC17_009026 [Serendipita sp. 399]
MTTSSNTPLNTAVSDPNYQTFSHDGAESNRRQQFWTNIRTRLGFQKRYNFTFCGSLASFSLANLGLLNPQQYSDGLPPGETYWVRSGIRKAGMIIHLSAILPCGILTVLQFIPKIRKNYMLFHRINGYVVLALLIIGLAGAMIISGHAFGGDIASAGGLYTLALLVIGCAYMGYYNIKRLQIEEHRKWMLRAMVYLSSVITQRIIMVITAIVITQIGGFSTPWYCDEIAYALNYNDTRMALQGSPECVGGATPFRKVLIPARLEFNQPIQMGSALRIAFGNSIWLGLLIHVFLLEVYLHLTPSETARLRSISYQKQLEAGFTPPGSAGITSDRWGDAEPYRPK